MFIIKMFVQTELFELKKKVTRKAKYLCDTPFI